VLGSCLGVSAPVLGVVLGIVDCGCCSCCQSANRNKTAEQ
jgi:hypothetical protein